MLGLVMALSACDITFENDTGKGNPSPSSAQQNSSLAQHPAGVSFQVIATEKLSPATLPMLRAQVLLDRLGFSPGIIDGKDGPSFKSALIAFQQSRGLDETGVLDDRSRQALDRWKSEPAVASVKIPADFAKGPFVPNFPDDMEEQAKLTSLGYRGMMEALAERFHTDHDTLVALNSPTTKIGPGRVIRVPAIPDAATAKDEPDDRGWANTLASLGVDPRQPAGKKIVVDKSEGVLKVLSAEGRLISQFPATMGSAHDPLPIGNWKVTGISKNPEFHYNPNLFWDASSADKKAVLPPGPNGPVGVVWIDLSKPHYGIHGTSEPSTVGKAESHGCIRLANWNAARLAQMVRPGTPVVFQE